MPLDSLYIRHLGGRGDGVNIYANADITIYRYVNIYKGCERSAGRRTSRKKRDEGGGRGGGERARHREKGEDERRRSVEERGKSKLNIKLHFAIGGSRRKTERTDRQKFQYRKKGPRLESPIFLVLSLPEIR